MKPIKKAMKAKVTSYTHIYGCHQCESFSPLPVQYVSPYGKVFVFCDKDCLRTWLSTKLHDLDRVKALLSEVRQ